MKAYAVITGTGKGFVEIDIIEPTLAAARRHARVLRQAFGCRDARVKVFESEDAAYEWEARNR